MVRVLKPICSPRDTYDRIPSQIADNFGRSSEETLTLYDSILKRINDETNQKQINNLHIKENARSTQFSKFHRSDPVSKQPIIQHRTSETKSDPSEERKKQSGLSRATLEIPSYFPLRTL